MIAFLVIIHLFIARIENVGPPLPTILLLVGVLGMLGDSVVVVEVVGIVVVAAT